MKLFHEQEPKPNAYSCGSIFPLVAPKQTNVKNKGEWNEFGIVMDWPRLRVAINGAEVQDFDLNTHPDLKLRLRRGYLGFESLSYPIKFRNLRIHELPGKDQWTPLFEDNADVRNWEISELKPVFRALNGVLRLEGMGHIKTRQQYRDFELQTYIRTSRAHNGGVLFRTSGQGLASSRHYEIQLHNVEGAHYPTGSLYYFKRAIYPRIEDEQWYLYQMWVKDRHVAVRINGETVMEYNELQNLEPGPIELQAHTDGAFSEYKHLWVRPL